MSDQSAEKPAKDFLGYEEGDALAEERELIKEREAFNPVPSIRLILLVFLLALAARLAVLFFVTGPGNAVIGDVYHHWQIAYLSKVVGFKHGFLRLRDFKGMEYYWGLLHPLVLIAGFTISRSVSVLVPQMVSVLSGSLAITLIFLIVARYFNKKAALASALFFSVMPVTLFHDTVGLQEPLGIFFLLLGIYLFPGHAFTAGFSWMLAGMVRAEHWLFGAGLLLAVLLGERNFDRKITALLGYGVPGIFYLKYMLDHTGNPIYPIYWNFLAIMVGEWTGGKTGVLTAAAQHIKLACQILAGSLFISGLILLWKRSKPYLFLLLGFAYLTFVFSVFGFGGFIYGYQGWPRFVGDLWIGKISAFSWGFLGTLTAIFLLYSLPKKAGRLGTLFGALVFLVGLGVTQLSWPSINRHYLPPGKGTEGDKKVAEAIAGEYTGEGTILVPGRTPNLTYALVYDEGISGEQLISTFYDPFYYYKGEDPFSEWDTFREEIIEWLEKHKAELFVITDSEIMARGGPAKSRGRMIELEEGKLFELITREGGYWIHKVKVDGSQAVSR